jgi:hypothetical protein
MRVDFEGQLEIDTDRGVIYFHDKETGGTILRISKLPPIPHNIRFIDLAKVEHHSYLESEG